MATGMWKRRLGTVARLASGELAKRWAASQTRTPGGSKTTAKPPRVKKPQSATRASGTVSAGPSPQPGAVPQPTPGPRPAPRGTPPGTARAPYPGDFTGAPPWEYDPREDGLPDPGEVVWAWVPYEEDHSQGKDRPALVIGREGRWLLAMPLTSEDHDRDAAQEARAGRYWVDVGSGAWDRSGRASEARIDRVVRLDPGAVRRDGAALSRAVFNEVIDARQHAYDTGLR